MDPESWFLIGHIVCISQWCAFIMVDYAYLGKGRVRPLWLWTTVLVAGELFLGIKLDIGFFTLLSIWENVGFVLVSTLLFGGTLAQKLTAALINGTMCLLAENTVRYVASWATHTSLLMIWKRMDCLVAMTITNVIVGVLVAYFSHKWKTERALESPTGAGDVLLSRHHGGAERGADDLRRGQARRFPDASADAWPDCGSAHPYGHRPDVQRPDGAAASAPRSGSAGAGARRGIDGLLYHPAPPDP